MCTHWIVSFESTDGTNALLMKSPVGTVIFLLVPGTVTVAAWAMTCRRLEKVLVVVVGGKEASRWADENLKLLIPADLIRRLAPSGR